MGRLFYLVAALLRCASAVKDKGKTCKPRRRRERRDYAELQYGIAEEFVD